MAEQIFVSRNLSYISYFKFAFLKLIQFPFPLHLKLLSIPLTAEHYGFVE